MATASGIRRWTFGQFVVFTLAVAFVWIASALVLGAVQNASRSADRAALVARATGALLIAIPVVWFVVAWKWFGRTRTD